jgi:hypothetical protein
MEVVREGGRGQGADGRARRIQGPSTEHDPRYVTRPSESVAFRSRATVSGLLIVQPLPAKDEDGEQQDSGTYVRRRSGTGVHPTGTTVP